jgi:hypothetical protein
LGFCIAVALVAVILKTAVTTGVVYFINRPGKGAQKRRRAPRQSASKIMNPRVLNLIVLVVMTVGTARADTRTFADENERFQLSVPPNWTIVPGGFHVTHYRFVQLCFNNVQDEDLRVVNWTEQTDGALRSTYNQSTVSRQLLPGTVYVDIAKWDGPPVPIPPYAWSPDLRPKSMIASFMESKPVLWDTAELDACRIGFLKWGWSWDIHVYCRKPYDKSDLETAFQIIESLEFIETPIVTDDQAVEAAILFLPQEAQPLPTSEGCNDYFMYDVSVEHGDRTFIVTFTKLDGTEARRPLQSFLFFVSSDGRVEPGDAELGRDRPTR